MSFTPTPQQVAIVSRATDTTDNFAVIARAGAAKTTTLQLIAEALPDTSILCIAFNKKISLEMQERLPPNTTSKTLHALGYKAWSDFIRKRLKVDSRKVYFTTRAIIEKEPDLIAREELFEDLSTILDAVNAAKAQGYIPPKYKGHWKSLVDKVDFYLSLPLELTDTQERIVDEVLIESFKAALAGTIDFSDMIYCPALCSVSWPVFPLTLIDEAQDLSPIDQHILKKMVKNRRIIAVGDPLQAIYGFRGALADSMDRLISRFSMDRLFLTKTFRCGENIVRNVHWRAPDMEWADTTPPGEVLTLVSWSADEIPEDSAIICRNNAPLFTMAIRLLQGGRAPRLGNTDVIAALVKIMKTLGKVDQQNVLSLAALDDWEETMIRRARKGAVGEIKDRAECIRLFLNAKPRLKDSIDYIQSLAKMHGHIDLTTGHKSKGLEFNNVFFLDRDLINEGYEQDLNLRYVIETRAKRSLFYVKSENYVVDELALDHTPAI